MVLVQRTTYVAAVSIRDPDSEERKKNTGTIHALDVIESLYGTKIGPPFVLVVVSKGPDLAIKIKATNSDRYLLVRNVMKHKTGGLLGMTRAHRF
jgi:hypothetical protein